MRQGSLSPPFGPLVRFPVAAGVGLNAKAQAPPTAEFPCAVTAWRGRSPSCPVTCEWLVGVWGRLASCAPPCDVLGQGCLASSGAGRGRGG